MKLRLGLFLVASALSAQAPIPLGDRPGALSEGFSYVIGLAELTDGRVIVSDFRAKLLYTGDFKSGAVQQLGRNGEGPGEYQMVQGVFRVLGDTLVMVDFPGRR